MSKNFDKLLGISSEFEKNRQLEKQLSSYQKVNLGFISKFNPADILRGLESHSQVNMMRGLFTKPNYSDVLHQIESNNITRALFGKSNSASIFRQFDNQVQNNLAKAIFRSPSVSDILRHVEGRRMLNDYNQDKLFKALGMTYIGIPKISQVEKMLQVASMNDFVAMDPDSFLSRNSWLKNVLPRGIEIAPEVEEDVDVNEIAEVAVAVSQRETVTTEDIQKVNDVLLKLSRRVEDIFNTIQSGDNTREQASRNANKITHLYFFASLLIALITFVLSTAYPAESKRFIKGVLEPESEQTDKLSWTEMREFLMLTDSRVCKRKINLRIRPSTQGGKIGSILGGKIVTVLQIKQRWVFVIFIDKSTKCQKSGWVYKKYLTKIL